MHVLYVIDSLAPGGAERSLAALAPRYAARGVALDVAYLKERPGVQGELVRAGATLFSLAGSGGRAGWVRRATRLVRRRRPDLVHTTLFEADIAGRVAASLAGVPVVSSLVNPEYGPEQLSDPRLSRWKVRGARLVDALTARRVARFHAITSYVADVMAGRLGLRRDRIDVVPRGRDPEELGRRSPERRAAARDGMGVGPETAVVLAAARHEHQKGLDVLLEAFPLVLREVPSARLVVAGREGNQTPLLRTAVERLGLAGAVRFLGVRDDVPDLLCAADVFVLPSRWEGLGSVLLEAMALEAPIVASDVPAVREVVGDGEEARLVPPERPDALASRIVATLADARGAADRARRARARFLQRYTIDRVADQMIAFYDRSVSPHRAVSPV